MATGRQKTRGGKKSRDTRNKSYVAGQKILTKVSQVISDIPDGERDSLKTELQTVVRQLEMAQIELQNQEKDCTSSKSTMNDSASIELNRLQTEVTNLQQKMESQKSDYASTLESVNDQLARVISKNASLTTAQEMWTHRQNEIVSKLEVCNGTQRECTSKWTSLQKEKEELELLMMRERDEYEKALNSEISKATKVSSSLSIKTTEVEKLTKSLNTLRGKYESEIRKREEEIEKLSSALSNQRVRTTQLEIDIASIVDERNAISASMKTTHEDYKRQLDILRKENMDREKTAESNYISAITSKETYHQKRYSDLANVHERLKNDLSRAAEKRDEFYSKLQIAENDLILRKHALEKARVAYSKTSEDNLEGRKKLQGEIDILKSEIIKEMEKSHRLEQDVIDHQNFIAELNDKIEAHIRGMESMKQNFEKSQVKMRVAYETQKAEIESDFKKRISEMEIQMAEDDKICKQTKNDLGKTINDKTKMLQDLQSSYMKTEKDFKVKIDNMERDAVKKENEYRKLEMKLNTQLEEQRRIVEQHLVENKNHTQTITKLKELVREKEMDIRNMSDAYSRKQKEQEAIYQKTETERLQLVSMTSGLQEKLAEKTEQLTSSQRKLDDTNRRVARLKEKESELERTKIEFDLMRKTLESETRDHKNIISNYDKAMQKLNERESQVTQLNTEYDLLKTRFAEVSRTLDELKIRNKQTLDDYSQCKRSESELSNYLTTETSKRESGEVRLGECMAAQREAVNTLTETRKNVESLESRKLDLESQLRETNEKLRMTAEQCSRDNARCDRERERMTKDHNKQISALQNQVQDNLRVAAQVREAMNKVQREHQAAVAIHTKSLLERRQTETQLRNDLEKLKADNEAYVKQIDELKRVHDAATRSIKQRITESEKDKLAIIAEMDEIKQECNEKRVKYETQGKQCLLSLEQRDKELRDRGRANFTLQRTLESAKSEVETEKSKCREQQKRLSMQFRSNIKNLTKLIDPEKRNDGIVLDIMKTADKL